MSMFLCAITVCALGAEPALQSRIDQGLPPMPTGVRVVWEVEQHAGLTRDELGAMRRRIAGKPDHPDRPQAESAERILTHGPDRLRREMWVDGSGRFRVCETRASRVWEDVVVADGVVWALSPDTLNIVDGTREPPPGRNFRPARDEAQRNLGGFVLGGLSMIIGAPKVTVQTFGRSGSEWNATAMLPDNIGEFSFRGVERGGHLLATEGRVRRLDPAPSEVGFRIVASEPWFDSPIGVVFRVVENYSPSGALRSRHRLVEVEPWPGDRSYFAVPDRSQPRDAVRGDLNLLSVADFRDDPAGRFWRRESADETFEKGPPPPHDPARALVTLDRAGYLILIGAGVFVAAVWLRQRTG